jgi:hypothetical protein
LLGTVPDGVKRILMTALRAKMVAAQWKRDGVKSRPSRVKVVTAQSNITYDGVRSGSRQSDYIFGGGLTASEVSS